MFNIILLIIDCLNTHLALQFLFGFSINKSPNIEPMIISCKLKGLWVRFNFYL